MGYRVLEVGEKNFEYVIGRSHTKVKLNGKNFGLFENSLIGEYEATDELGRVKITPAILKRAIEKKLAGELV